MTAWSCFPLVLDFISFIPSINKDRTSIINMGMLRHWQYNEKQKAMLMFREAYILYWLSTSEQPLLWKGQNRNVEDFSEMKGGATNSVVKLRIRLLE